MGRDSHPESHTTGATPRQPRHGCHATGATPREPHRGSHAAGATSQEPHRMEPLCGETHHRELHHGMGATPRGSHTAGSHTTGSHTAGSRTTGSYTMGWEPRHGSHTAGAAPQEPHHGSPISGGHTRGVKPALWSVMRCFFCVGGVIRKSGQGFRVRKHTEHPDFQLRRLQRSRARGKTLLSQRQLSSDQDDEADAISV